MLTLEETIVGIRFISSTMEELYVTFPGIKFYQVVPLIISHVKNGGCVRILGIDEDVTVVSGNLNELFWLIGCLYQTNNVYIDMEKFVPAFIEYSNKPIIATILESEFARQNSGTTESAGFTQSN